MNLLNWLRSLIRRREPEKVPETENWFEIPITPEEWEIASQTEAAATDSPAAQSGSPASAAGNTAEHAAGIPAEPAPAAETGEPPVTREPEVPADWGQSSLSAPAESNGWGQGSFAAPAEPTYEAQYPDYADRILRTSDDNIAYWRSRYPEGLHFVVGDTHGQGKTLACLMEKISFDPAKDHVYFVGDYNAGHDVRGLLSYMSRFYEPDCTKPGFHMIRGNHERELWPEYPLENLPDILVWKGQHRNYYIVHAGMVWRGMELIAWDLQDAPVGSVHGYRLTREAAGENAPLRQIIWSRRGLYATREHHQTWPNGNLLRESRACILHGHTPFVFMKRNGHFSYGSRNLFFGSQRAWFSEDLQSFNLDANVKGRYEAGDTYRGLACVCLEALEEIAAEHGELTLEAVRTSPNFVYGVPLQYGHQESGDLSRILLAQPQQKTITVTPEGYPIFQQE